MAVLDNPVWHALSGPRQAFGSRLGGAAVFDADVGPFGAVESADGWADLAALVGPSGITCVLNPPRMPDGWTVKWNVPGVQMLATTALEPDDLGFVPLGPADAADMLDLVELTKPGPFGPRTVELGGFIGLREDGALVAMAGERVRCPGFTEVSGVCTLPTHRSRGLAGALTKTVGHAIQARGEEAFLHAAADNVNAIRLYASLGFVVRREVDFVIVQAPGGGG